ncbi:Sugar phosphate isomerase/epimerase [Pseudarcicella hirudinis]|uniref:Sugar phosphate isomerase/epimerase n=3 Tax=Pseudarcicella hirudinis TaxID=1079859 RepID=A0A1I5XXX9_9BACT|nr:Sugar phosphate isomerase/epimerase [Pseudarcicella hirudinis]
MLHIYTLKLHLFKQRMAKINTKAPVMFKPNKALNLLITELFYPTILIYPMRTLPRRDFLTSAAGLAGLGLLSSFDFAKSKPLLSFSTIGCPKWSFETIVEFAAKNGYDGIEIRGIQGQLDLSKCAEFNSPESIARSRKMVEDKGLRIVDLGSSAAMHLLDPVKRKNSLDEGKRFIELAQKLNCPNIRVFPNDLPKDQDRNQTIEAIIKGLLELGDAAKGSKVSVLMESHGEVVSMEMLEKIMKAAEHPNVGLVWDIFNMWSVTKESPKEVYGKLHKYIRHTHIKDAKLVNGKEEYVFLGQGETPLAEAFTALQKGGYKGYYSFEWEKLWHPELAEPELALPDYPKAIMKYW